MTADLGRDRIDEALRRFLDSSAAVVAGLGDELGPLVSSACDFVRSGGKRLRPLFCYWGYRAAGGADCDAVMAAAASLELVQACALAHDDLIDASDSRRGRPSLHREWAGHHGERGWTGDAERFGLAAGILIGDLFLAWSDAMFSTSGLLPEQLTRARPVWDLMRIELMAGQYLDVVEQARGESSLRRSLQIAALKSGRYSVERPLLLGAAIAGADAEAVETLGGFGFDIGVAFQLRDDLLGVFGDPAVTGKPAGDDLREGKRTALVAAAVDGTDPTARKTLLSRLGDPSLTEADVAELQQILVDSGAAATVERMIEERATRALDRLRAAGNLDPTGGAALRELAAAALQRRH